MLQKQQERIKELEKKLQEKNKPERIDWREKLEYDVQVAKTQVLLARGSTGASIPRSS